MSVEREAELKKGGTEVLEPISQEQKEIALDDLRHVEGLKDILVQEEIDLVEIVTCLEKRREHLIKLFGGQLKGVQRIEERGCRLALRGLVNEQITLGDLGPIREQFLKERAEAAAKLAQPQKRGLFGRLLRR